MNNDFHKDIRLLTMHDLTIEKIDKLATNLLNNGLLKVSLPIKFIKGACCFIRLIDLSNEAVYLN